MNRYRTILTVALIIAFGAMSIIGGNVVQAGAQPTLTVHVDHPLGAISPDLRGANQRYPDCGSYAWDCTSDAPVAAVVAGDRRGTQGRITGLFAFLVLWTGMFLPTSVGR